MIHTGTCNASQQAPWGRTTTSSFQVILSKYFHCLLHIKIDSFPFSNDYLSVWKRTIIVNCNNNSNDCYRIYNRPIADVDISEYDIDNTDDNNNVIDGDDELELDNSNNTNNTLFIDNNNKRKVQEEVEEHKNYNNNEDDDEEDYWKDIPLDERIPDLCAPCLQHLLI
jgi:hypothetical protein